MSVASYKFQGGCDSRELVVCSLTEEKNERGPARSPPATLSPKTTAPSESVTRTHLHLERFFLLDQCADRSTDERSSRTATNAQCRALVDELHITCTTNKPTACIASTSYNKLTTVHCNSRFIRRPFCQTTVAVGTRVRHRPPSRRSEQQPSPNERSAQELQTLQSANAQSAARQNLASQIVSHLRMGMW